MCVLCGSAKNAHGLIVKNGLADPTPTVGVLNKQLKSFHARLIQFINVGNNISVAVGIGN